MSCYDNASAIDDSGEATDPYFTGTTQPEPSGQLASSEIFQYRGPRSGHWTVKSTVHGSAIDDRGPVDPAVPATAQHENQTKTAPLAGSVANRLVQATRQQQQAEEKVVVKASGPASKRSTQKAEQRRPQGFFVPKPDRHGIRIVSKAGKHEIIRSPLLPMLVKETTKSEPPGPVKKAQEIPQNPSLSSEVGKPKDSSRIPSRNNEQRVRIVGKNGEEAFVELPNLPLRWKSMASARPEKIEKQTSREPETQKAKTQDTASERARRDNEAASMARHLREQRMSLERLAHTKTLPPFSTSAAASPVSRASAPLSQHSSGKSSARQPPGAWVDASEPASAASSKTSVLSPPKVGSQQHGTKSGGSRGSSQRPSISGWHELGSYEFDPAAQPGYQSQKISSSRSFSQRAITLDDLRSGHIESHRLHASGSHHVSLQRERSTKSNPPDTLNDVTPPDQNVRERENNAVPSPNEPTVFAGRGWISPHPLSVAPSEFQEPPDRSINIPSRHGQPGGATMTFDEWKNIHKDEEEEEYEALRRNYSRSSSAAGPYTAGSWGHRKTRQSESVHSHAQMSYKSPVVDSEHGGGDNGHAFGFDGARDVDGQTHLRMPWDSGSQ